MLSRIYWPEFPVPVGVIRNVDRPTHDQLLTAQIEKEKARAKAPDLQRLLNGGETWVVE